MVDRHPNPLVMALREAVALYYVEEPRAAFSPVQVGLTDQLANRLYDTKDWTAADFGASRVYRHNQLALAYGPDAVLVTPLGALGIDRSRAYRVGAVDLRPLHARLAALLQPWFPGSRAGAGTPEPLSSPRA